MFASGWIYKTTPQYNIDRKNKKPLHRFVLNVDPNSDLLTKLDDFAQKYACQYKCAEAYSMAYNRPDTIVIYTSDERFDEQKNELAGLVKPYVRQNGNDSLDGDKIAEGLYTAKETSREDIEQLLQKYETVYPRLANYVQGILENNPKKQHPLSLGEYTVIKDMFESVEILKGGKAQEKTDEKTQPQPQNEAYTRTDILREGITGPYSKSDEIKNFSAMPEVGNTAKAKYKLNPKNPDEISIDGQDKNGKHTFSASYNRKTGIYVYQGGKPSKTYSNDPNLKFPPLPDKVLSSLKENHRMTINKAHIRAEMRNGITLIEGDKKISVKQEKVGDHENCLVFEKFSKDGKQVSKFVIDRTTGDYMAMDYQTGEKFSNSAKLAANNNLRPLPDEVLKRFQNRIKTAENYIIQQNTHTKDSQRQ